MNNSFSLPQSVSAFPSPPLFPFFPFPCLRHEIYNKMLWLLVCTLVLLTDLQVFFKTKNIC